MQSAGLELRGEARSDLDSARKRTHLHDAILHRHLVDLGATSDIRRHGNGNEPIGGRPAVLDHDVPGGDNGTVRRGARPGMRNVQRTLRVVVCARRTSHDGGCEADERDERPSSAMH